MLRVGLTGPMASGKSTVGDLFAAEGFPVIDADRVAHELYVPGSALVAALATEFGAEILDPQGRVDRRLLGARVFEDPILLERLNTLVHPVLHQELITRLGALETAGHTVAILEAALLLRWDARLLVDVVVGVTSPREVRRDRLRAVGRPHDDARLDAQMTDQELRDAADFLIENDGPLWSLKKHVHSVAVALRQRAAQHREEDSRE